MVTPRILHSLDGLTHPLGATVRAPTGVRHPIDGDGLRQIATLQMLLCPKRNRGEIRIPSVNALTAETRLAILGHSILFSRGLWNGHWEDFSPQVLVDPIDHFTVVKRIPQISPVPDGNIKRNPLDGIDVSLNRFSDDGSHYVTVSFFC